MILFINSMNRSQYKSQMDEYFAIRKTVFCDMLKWDIPSDGNLEYDRYDFMPCTYVLSLDKDGSVVGGLRMMKMAGPNLTWEKFADLVDDPLELFCPRSTEITRFAIRPKDKDIRMNSGVNRAAVELCSASLEYSLQRGKTRHVAVCEERVVRLTKTFGVGLKTLGRSRGTADSDILCVSWDVSDASTEKLAWAKQYLAAG